MTPAEAPFAHVHWGRLGYDEAHRRQREARDALIAGTGPEVVFTVEHPPVITGGRRAREADLVESRPVLERRGVAVRDIERGGDWTYHGPGQLVAYAIVDLTRRRLRVPCFVAGLEDAMAETVYAVLDDLGLDRGELARVPRPDAPGTWFAAGDGPAMKVGAVGVHIRRSVPLHGLALNLAPDPWGFAWIVPCGLPGQVTTSVARIATALGSSSSLPSLETVASSLVGRLPAAWAARA